MILIRAKIIVHAEFQLSAERLVERLVFLAVFFQQALQLAFDFLADVFRDQLQLAVMLQHFSGNIQRQILRIDHALHKAEVVR